MGKFLQNLACVLFKVVRLGSVCGDFGRRACSLIAPAWVAVPPGYQIGSFSLAEGQRAGVYGLILSRFRPFETVETRTGMARGARNRRVRSLISSWVISHRHGRSAGCNFAHSLWLLLPGTLFSAVSATRRANE